MTDQIFTISDSASQRLAALMADEKPGSRFRIQVDGGGCSGFQYNFSFVTEKLPDDEVIEKNGVAVVIDEVSLGFLKGSELDFIETLGEASFRITNPNATAKCGCGNSFAV